MSDPTLKDKIAKKINTPVLVARLIKNDGTTELVALNSEKLTHIKGGSPNHANGLDFSGPDGEAMGLMVLKAQNTAALTPDCDLMASRVWNAVWNDYADFQLLNDELVPGKCYIDTEDGAKICTERCQLSVIGLATDTFAQAVGTRRDQRQVPIAVAGWALAHVDKAYPCGTPLTNDENGNLTEMTLNEKRDYPERLIAIYKRKEHDEEFGSESRKVKVNNRHWVKVK